MLKNFDELQQLGQDQVDNAVKTFGAVSRGVQAIAAEVADYSKASIEQGGVAMEKLMSANSLDRAMAVQADFAREAFDTFMARSSKLGDLYMGLAKEAYKPLETMVAKAASSR